MAKKYDYNTFTLQTPKVFNSHRNYGYPDRAFESKFVRPVGVSEKGVKRQSKRRYDRKSF